MNINATFSSEQTYSIEIGENLWGSIEKEKKRLFQTLLVTDQLLFSLYKKEIQSLFSPDEIILVEEGEKIKNQEVLDSLEKELFKREYPRDGALFVMGGGALLDAIGFLSSIYLRGIPFISIPTTLLAMVDASIGGKTAINTRWGKNLIGSIYHPQKIFIDLLFLDTLPISRWKEGFSEIIKAALIVDEHFFYWIEDKKESWKRRDKLFLQELIQRSIQIKLQITQKDTRESSLRKILNFGHTIAHPLEALSGYTLSHGKAVAFGMLVAAHLSLELGYLPFQDWEKILSLFSSYEIIPNSFPDFSEEDFFSFLSRDKKRKKGEIEMILLRKIGRSFLSKEENITLSNKQILDAMDKVKEICLPV